MKTFARIAGGLLAAVLLLAVAAVVQSWYFKPLSIDVFFERALLKQALGDPELLSQLRILEPVGISFHNDELTDASPAYKERLAAQARANLATLRAYERAELDEGRAQSYDVLDWYLQNQVDGEPWIYHDYPVNQMFGVQASLPTFMTSVHQIRDASGARDYVARLEKFPAKFAQVLEGLRLRESRGVVPPRFTIDKVVTQLRGFVAAAPADHLLTRHLRDQLARLDRVPPAERDAILAAGRDAVARAVIPAYQSLLAYLEELAPKVTTHHGAWALPDGDKYYAWCVQNHTTLTIPPEQVHEIGVTEVARIEAGMDAILRGQGLTQGSVGTRAARLAADPRHQYPDSDDSREQILREYQVIIDEISAGLDPYFGLKPAAGVVVKRIEPFREQTAPGAHYLPPAMDGSRPGIFYANLRSVPEVYKWGMRTLAYHEAVPGHHFQIAIAQGLRDVPTFRRLPLFTAYIEGWALYAERLAQELGYQKDPLDDLGRLQAEMFRAVRLVVDTGIHQQRWTREQAIAYMLDKTGQPEADVVAEIERYFVAPGQALAYKTGMMKLLELRERARTALGPAFDLRAFHDLILGGGPMPLPVLEQRLEQYLAAQPGRQATALR